MSGTGNQVRSFFDGLADSYADQRYGEAADAWRAYFFGGRLRLAAELLRDARGTVVDLGSGPGVLGEVLGDGTRIVHVDLSPEMLDRTGGGGIVADARAVPLGDGGADVVVALGLTAYLDDLEPLLAEARRVLRPGGRLLLSVTRRAAPDTLLRGLFRNTLGRIGRGRSVLGAGLRIRTWSDGEVRRAVRRAGLRPLAIRRHNFTVFPFCYLFRRSSVRLGKSLEQHPGAFRSLGSDDILLLERVPRPASASRRRIRVLRAIARLNVGGPARQAISLTRDLDALGYESTLVTGRVEEHEGDMLPDARAAGLEPELLWGLSREVRLLGDVRSFLGLLRRILATRPDIVHTHTAKAGALGRIAAFLAGVPVRIHTFHGHVLHGYFGQFGSALVRAAELLLARITTRTIAVSEEVARDLTERHRVLPASKVRVVPLGLELDEILDAERMRGELRGELDIPEDAPVVISIGRVTAVKEPGVLLDAAKLVLDALPETRFVIAGGGDLLEDAKRNAVSLGISDRVIFLGWRSDVARLLADADLALLTSRNEGTPVALIEAAAAGVPAVATRVGGVPAVVEHGVTGLLAPPGDAEALAAAVTALLSDPERRRAAGAAARRRVFPHFSTKRLLQDIDRLYRVSLAEVGRTFE